MVRNIVTREVSRKKLDYYRERGWQVLHASRGVYRIRKKLSKWEKFEARMRELFQMAGFDHAIDPYEFWYDDLGQQVDVCGGVGEHFIVMDCTTKRAEGFKSLKEKIKDNLYKMKTLERGVESTFKGRYKQVHFVICTEDVDQNRRELKEALDRGIRVVDSSLLDQWTQVVKILGPGIRYQILEVLAGAKIPIEDGTDKPFSYRALRIPVGSPDGGEGLRYLYAFAMDPETLLKLAVVYRLKYMDPAGYQRDLKPGKLRSINEYLSDWTRFFPNSVLIAFDEEGTRKIRWKADSLETSGPVGSGWILIPRFHCIAEIIDGQHRLHGYIDFTKGGQFEKLLAERRKKDRLVTVAITDPAEAERPGLYLSINSTQTKISSREIWALMAEARPKSKMGFIANIVCALNEDGVFRDDIEIPRCTRGRRSINIANLGKGISDRHLVDQEGDFHWNLWKGPRITAPFPDVADARIVNELDLFFRCVRDSHRGEWASRVSFLRSNNGVNVMLRVLVEVLKYSKAKLKKERVSRLLRPVMKSYVDGHGGRELLASTSNEVGREKVAREIMARINRKMPGFALEYLEQRKRRK